MNAAKPPLPTITRPKGDDRTIPERVAADLTNGARVLVIAGRGPRARTLLDDTLALLGRGWGTDRHRYGGKIVAPFSDPVAARAHAWFVSYGSALNGAGRGIDATRVYFDHAEALATVLPALNAAVWGDPECVVHLPRKAENV